MKPIKLTFISFGTIVLFTVLLPNVLGCTCGGYSSVCEAYSSAQAVFAGTVTNVESIDYGWKHFIKIEKTYKGKPQSEIILATENTTCSGKYDVGSKLLLYAYFNKKIKMWVINDCVRNTSINDANDDLLFLNGLPKTANRTRISGDLLRYETTPESGFTKTQTFVGAKVKLASKTKTFEVLSDENGVYEIYDLPLDVYAITPEIPKGLKIKFPVRYGSGGFLEDVLNKSNSVSVDLKDNRCVGVDFIFNTNNKISGKVYDANNKPMKNVCPNLIPLVEKKSSYFRVFDCTEEDGSFVLDDMPAGKYLILTNDDGKISSSEPFPSLYYPNTFDKEKAAVITIGEGEFRENYDIHVPSQSETITATGILLYSDGKPVVDEFVEFQADKKQAGIEDRTNTKTDSEGRFSVRILKGLKGKIYGGMNTYRGEFKKCPALDTLIKEKKKGIGYFTVETAPQEINAESNTGNIVLKFSFPNCVKAKEEN